MPRRGDVAECCILLVFRLFEASGMPARHGNNMKYFRRLRTALRIGSEIVPFFHTACLPFMQRSSPVESNEHQRSTRPPPRASPPSSRPFAKRQALAAVIAICRLSVLCCHRFRFGPPMSMAAGKRSDLMRCLWPRAGFGSRYGGREAICVPQEGRPWVGLRAGWKIHPIPASFSRTHRH
jgi:hypothetical protein